MRRPFEYKPKTKNKKKAAGSWSGEWVNFFFFGVISLDNFVFPKIGI
jgi:hypothetical protein